MQDKADAVRSVVVLLARIERLRRPLHFHPHNSYPLSIFSVFGALTLLSLLQQIRLPFLHRGYRCSRRRLGVLACGSRRMPPWRVSFRNSSLSSWISISRRITSPCGTTSTFFPLAGQGLFQTHQLPARHVVGERGAVVRNAFRFVP